MSRIMIIRISHNTNKIMGSGVVISRTNIINIDYSSSQHYYDGVLLGTRSSSLTLPELCVLAGSTGMGPGTCQWYHSDRPAGSYGRDGLQKQDPGLLLRN